MMHEGPSSSQGMKPLELIAVLTPFTPVPFSATIRVPGNYGNTHQCGQAGNIRIARLSVSALTDRVKRADSGRL
jgi:hypothetical protein